MVLEKSDIMSKNSENPWLIIALLLVIAVALAGLAAQKNSDVLSTGEKNVVTQEVQYFEDANGFLARPQESGSYPGVVMIHEWWGLNQNIKDMARELATQGYVVLAVDLYGGEIAATSDEARSLVSSLNQSKSIENMKAATAYLKTQNADKIASLGWCFGGGQSLQLSLSDDIDATVIYYGNLVTEDARLSSLNSPVLGIFGDKDTSIPVSSVNDFDAALGRLSIENEIYIYAGVGHAFANPSGMNYAPIETKNAWDKTLAFLEKHLKN